MRALLNDDADADAAAAAAGIAFCAAFACVPKLLPTFGHRFLFATRMISLHTFMRVSSAKPLANEAYA